MFKTKDNFLWINNCGSFAEKLIYLDNYGSFSDESFLAAGSDISVSIAFYLILV